MKLNKIGVQLYSIRGYLDTEEQVKVSFDKLKKMGYEPQRMGSSGLVATVGKGNGKTFLLRADMDALPVTEQADIDFKSTNGNMHACGHDMHTTSLLGAAQLLKAHEAEIEGTVKLMFQPAEETMDGGKMMVEAGICEGVDAAFFAVDLHQSVVFGQRNSNLLRSYIHNQFAFHISMIMGF